MIVIEHFVDIEWLCFRPRGLRSGTARSGFENTKKVKIFYFRFH